jgi:amidase
MATFIERTEIGTRGTTVAVKDLIDLAGLPTTAGCRAIADRATPATRDASSLRGLRAAVEAGEARIVGKANLDELAASAHGVNPWFGTPRNPRDPGRVPGGSSSGSAVAVATGEAEVAIGTDTGGSVRIPAACCGVTGLKTTRGRIPTDGVVPFSETLDTVGPLARDVAGVVRGMELLEPGFSPAPAPARSVGRVRLPGTDPRVDAAVDAALTAAGLEAEEFDLEGWEAAFEATIRVGMPEGFRNHGAMIEREPEKVGPVGDSILAAREQVATLPEARLALERWAAELAAAFGRVELLALPTLRGEPPTLERAEEVFTLADTLQVNGAGLPALAQPIAAPGPLPPSLQLIGPAGSEELLLATGAAVEAAAGAPIG